MSKWFTPSMTRGSYELNFNDPQSAAAAINSEGIPYFVQDPLFDSIPNKIGSHAATITAFPDGELLAAWYSYEGPEELDGSAIYMSRRPTGCERWEQPVLLIDNPQGDGNPVLYSEQDRVWLFHAVAPQGWATSHIEWQLSQDRGRTWSPTKSMVSPYGWNVRYPPVRTAEGMLLLPAYTEVIPRTVFYMSPDGQQWKLMGEVRTYPENIQASVAALADGRLIAVMRNWTGGWLWAMGSDDSGWNWSHPIDSGFPNPGSAACLLSLASGNLLLVFNDSPSERVPLSVAISGDGGSTWPMRKVIAQGESSYSYPAATQTPDGIIHILYSFGRQRIEHVALNEAWLASPEP